jgi:hypothetical protein
MEGTRITTRLNRVTGIYSVQANASIHIGSVARKHDGTWTAYVNGLVFRGHKTMREAVAEVTIQSDAV